ncbi:MAG: hypothetical protein H5T63_11510 [Chloroflexi bacterium]|nr:hypothetical protein [Chloroflexota bacterium]
MAGLCRGYSPGAEQKLCPSSSTGYFDIRSGQWWPEMLAFLGVPADALPAMHRSGEAIGYVVYWQDLVLGTILILAVVSDRLTHRGGT